MATIHDLRTGEEKNENPVFRKKYLWFCHDKLVLLVIPISNRLDQGGWLLNYEVYKGCYSSNSTTLTWTQQELDNATLFLYPGKPKLNSREELCRSCSGSYVEQGRDLTFLLCCWCNRTGKQKKQQDPRPTHSQRSPLHPRVPLK